MGYFKIFGCIAYAFVKPQNREKFDEKGEKYLFIGYSDESKGYRLLDPRTNQLVISRDVVFDEMVAWNWKDEDTQASHSFSYDLDQPISTEDDATELRNPQQSSISSPLRSQAQDSTQNLSDSEPPPRKVQSLRDVYESCDVALFSCEP